MNDGEYLCNRVHCYGVVKKYNLNGPRDPPPEVIKQSLSITTKIKKAILTTLGISTSEVEWYECSVCHKYHPELVE